MKNVRPEEIVINTINHASIFSIYSDRVVDFADMIDCIEVAQLTVRNANSTFAQLDKLPAKCADYFENYWGSDSQLNEIVAVESYKLLAVGLLLLVVLYTSDFFLRLIPTQYKYCWKETFSLKLNQAMFSSKSSCTLLYTLSFAFY